MEWLTQEPSTTHQAGDDDTPSQATPTAPPTEDTEEQLHSKLAGVYLIWSVFYTHVYQPKVLVSAKLIKKAQRELDMVQISPLPQSPH